MAAALAAVVTKYDLKGQILGDVACGAVIKHSRDWNLARESVIPPASTCSGPAARVSRLAR
jgi:acetyl-CoA C-acetyltransferase